MSTAPLTVYFDGGCPFCVREIGFYRRLRGADKLYWVDVANCSGAELGPGLDREAALRQLHVRAADGSLHRGAAAFVAIWRQLPAFSWLGVITSPRPMQRVLELGYRGFLKVRPLWRSAPESCPLLPADVAAELRTDHAGEVGAMQIYRGILAVTRDPGLREFATRHHDTEAQHLQQLEEWLAKPERSRLLPLWSLAGWLTGAVPALAGPRAVYATVAAVEGFVDDHYAKQIERLRHCSELDQLRLTLEACRHDEVAHRDEAAAAVSDRPGWLLGLWTRSISVGSALAVAVSRQI